MENARIIGFATLAAIAYGILHDQVTAHLCVEYFTIGHPPIFATSSPFLLALGWGVIATWWVGLPLGIGLAIAARAGPAPKLALAQLRRPILLLMLGCGGAGAACRDRRGDRCGDGLGLARRLARRGRTPAKACHLPRRSLGP